MSNLTITDRLAFDQYIDSKYPATLAKNFGYEHLVDREHRRWAMYNPEVYIVEANPKHNYGLDFKVFLRYKADGINFFKEISYGSSMLSNQGLREVSCLAFGALRELDFQSLVTRLSETGVFSKEEVTTITVGDQGYCKSDKKNRAYFRNQWGYKTFM